MTSPAQALTLCMIVRNESATIERCLDSVRPLISNWVICDTGSTDDTVDRIKDALAGIPGELHHRPWKNFGHNRSELMELARGTGDYLLLLDADMTVRQVEPVPALTKDAYNVRFDGSLSYVNLRVVKADRSWRYAGATHEYLTSDEPFETAELGAIRVVHHADGGFRHDKLERDLNLLRQDLAERPGDARSIFYLAQTHRDLGHTDEAIALYQRRAAMGGFAEEAFYAAHQAGLLRAKEDPARAIDDLVLAWESRPTRAEPLYDAVLIARQNKMWPIALELSTRGRKIPVPADDLFVQPWVYEWGLLLEYSIAAWWTNDPDEALAAAEELLALPDLPPQALAHARYNRDFFLSQRAIREGTAAAEPSPVVALESLAPDALFGRIQLDVDPDWPQFNPSIAAAGDGFRMTVRTASYEIHDGQYLKLDGDKIATLNYLVNLDAELAVQRVRPLRDVGAGPPRYDFEIEGFEDLRLIRFDDRWWATANVRDLAPDHRAQVVLLGLAGRRIDTVHLLDAGRDAVHEKNWMPFVADGGLHLVYKVSPTVIYRVDPDTGSLTLVLDEPGPLDAANLRGSSAGVPFDGGHLFVTHEARWDGNRADYIHRFVLLGPDFRVTALSDRFFFKARGIEYCAGLAPHRESFVLTFGREDREAWLGIVAQDAVRRMLKPVG